MKRAFALAVLLLSLPLAAQTRKLTFEDIFDPEKRLNFSGSIQTGFEWVDDVTVVWPKKNAAGKFEAWTLFDATNGRERALFDADRMQKALETAGVPPDLAQKAASGQSITFDRLKTTALLDIADDLYLYSIARGTATRLTSAPGKEETPSFSPDGRRVAFVRANDLFVVDLAARERRLTSDGSDKLLNGMLDWVYQEEVFGRGSFTGYWWSPDSQRLAYLQLDESPVPHYTIVDHIPYRPELEVYPYPKAGDPNPRVSLRVVRAAGGEPVVVDNERYSAGEFLIVGVTWSPDAKNVVYQVQDREQTWLDLVSASVDGASRVLLRETTKAWVEPNGNPVWLGDGGFLWQSERSGWRHVYRYRADATLAGAVTRGEWEVRNLHGVDGKNGLVYFTATERSPIGTDVYRVKLDGSAMQRLSEAAGSHSATFNPSFTSYVGRWSDVSTPDQVRLHRSDGKVLFTIDANKVPLLAEIALPRPEFLQVRTRDGFPMEAMILRPRDFDPKRKYPVYQPLYGGPASPSVTNRWRGAYGLFNQLVADLGVIVWVCDNRSASGKGAVSAWPVYGNLGELELRDTIDALDWLSGQPGVDGTRVLLDGWSYGGFMVTYAMTHSDRFLAGFAGGSVTDWRDYDSIYTERYMRMPQNNPEGYRKSGPRFAARNLKGNLMLVHGATDDNVHVQNTMQMAWELQQAGKSFEMMLLPKTRHSLVQRPTQAWVQKLLLDFIRRQLL